MVKKKVLYNQKESACSGGKYDPNASLRFEELPLGATPSA